MHDSGKILEKCFKITFNKYNTNATKTSFYNPFYKTKCAQFAISFRDVGLGIIWQIVHISFCCVWSCGVVEFCSANKIRNIFLHLNHESDFILTCFFITCFSYKNKFQLVASNRSS